jgi:hypothetical protein
MNVILKIQKKNNLICYEIPGHIHESDAGVPNPEISRPIAEFRLKGILLAERTPSKKIGLCVFFRIHFSCDVAGDAVPDTLASDICQ